MRVSCLETPSIKMGWEIQMGLLRQGKLRCWVCACGIHMFVIVYVCFSFFFSGVCVCKWGADTSLVFTLNALPKSLDCRFYRVHSLLTLLFISAILHASVCDENTLPFCACISSDLSLSLSHRQTHTLANNFSCIFGQRFAFFFCVFFLCFRPLFWFEGSVWISPRK